MVYEGIYHWFDFCLNIHTFKLFGTSLTPIFAQISKSGKVQGKSRFLFFYMSYK